MDNIKTDTNDLYVDSQNVSSSSDIERVDNSKSSESRSEIDSVASPKKTLSYEEVQQLITKARREEKDKLYKEQERLKKTIKELKEQMEQTKNAQLEEQKKQQELIERMKKVFLGEDAPDEDVTPDVIQERINAQQERLRELEEQQRRSAELIAELSKATKQTEIEKMRQSLIAQYQQKGVKFIPELVHGETEEEISQSIEHSAQLYKKHLGELEKQVEELKSKLEQSKNFVDTAVASTNVPAPASKPTAVENEMSMIQNYAEQIVDGNLQVSDIPDAFWRKHMAKINQAMVDILRTRRAQSSPKVTPTQHTVKTSVLPYKRYSRS